jgi:hypothetical protein
MNLENYQYLLAKIYTDADFREKFFAEPVKIGAVFQLEPALAQELAQKHQEAIDFFSDTLLRKRLQAVRNLLPQTVQILANQLNALFQSFAQNRPLLSDDRYAEDSFAFGKQVEKSAFFEKLNLNLKEKIIFEILQIRLERNYFRLRWFQFHPLKSEIKPWRKYLYCHFHFRGWYYARLF